MSRAEVILILALLLNSCQMPTNEKAHNRLINATSPYLLQHAYNPVDWYEWGEEALKKAKNEDLPILISIGYSSCHWCHVMERESFEDQDIAAIMNANFVCIKVDREERPDIDQIYMEAVQAMGLNGGWPLNVFLTPDQKPFYGGTYFPPKNWAQLLLQIAKAYRERRAEIASSADELAARLAASDIQRFQSPEGSDSITKNGFDEMFKSLSSKFDNEWGGLDRAPKFVMPSQWLLLLRYYARTGNEEAKRMVIFTLKKMAMGGLYDQVGGGFARYSVDSQWFAPHFEKMLYDNAQLLSLYAEAYTLTKDEFFGRIIVETVEWLEREMTSPEGGFFSALDADSDGEEGKYYVWKKNEFERIVGDSANWICEFFNLTDSGNWEHGNNILFIDKEPDELIKKYKLTHAQFEEQLATAKQKLLKERQKRIKPGLDDKNLAGWNAMTIKGLCDAFIATGEKHFLELAIQNIQFIESHLIEDRIYRSYRGRKSEIEGFLEDYAFVIQSYLSLYEVTFDEAWLTEAKRWAEFVVEKFYDEDEGYFHFASHEAEPLIARKKELFDNVIPSSNAVMARNLSQLGRLFDNDRFLSLSRDMVTKLAYLIENAAGDMSYWAIVYSEMISSLAEVVIVSEDLDAVASELRKSYQPFALIMGTKKTSDLPLLKDKTNPGGERATIYVCFNKTCKLPVHTVGEALAQIPLAR